MAFLGQLGAKFNELKAATKSQLPQVVEHANKAKQTLVPVLNRCTEKLDNLARIDVSKIINVKVDGRKQSPIDLLPAITAFDSALESASFQFNYDETAQLVVRNMGSCISIRYPEGSASDNLMAVSFLADEQYRLERVDFHHGTEPMNGSEHTVGGVGYAGEIHFTHRNLKYPSLETASKQPDGVVALAVFLNESHDDNVNLIALMKVLPNVHYSGNESGLTHFRVGQLVPSSEKAKDFWVYDGSETIEPYRELVKWIVFRSAVPISSGQLESFRELYKSRAEDEVEERMVAIRPLQPVNSRLVRSSFRSVAGIELP